MENGCIIFLPLISISIINKFYGQFVFGVRPENCFWGLLMATSNFAFEVKAILGLESTHLESRMAKIGLNGPHCQ